MKSKMLVSSERSLLYSPCECLYFCYDYIYDLFCFPSPKREERQEIEKKERDLKRKRKDTLILCEGDCEKCETFKKRRRVDTENTPLLLFSPDSRNGCNDEKEEKEEEKEGEKEEKEDWNIV